MHDPSATASTLRSGGPDGSGRAPLAIVFALFGVAQGSWAGRIPWIQDARHLSDGALGLALLGPAIGGILAMPLAGRLVARHGSRTVARWAVLVLAISLALPALAPSLPTLLAVLVVFGAAGGVLDVACNAGGVEVEQRRRRATMSGLHGMWSLGGLVGAAAAGLVAGADVGAPVHLAMAALVVAVAGSLATVRLVLAAPVDGVAPAFAWPSRAVLALGAVGFASLFTEGAAGDWSAVYLRDVGGTSAATGATGYAVFSLTMAGVRFLGDALVTRWGATNLVRASCTAGALGLAFAVLVPGALTGVVGFGLLGLGLGCVIPLVFGAAGTRGGERRAQDIAAVATLSYAGWLVAPTVVGGIAEASSLRVSFGVAAALTASIVLLAGALRPQARGMR